MAGKNYDGNEVRKLFEDLRSHHGIKPPVRVSLYGSALDESYLDKPLLPVAMRTSSGSRVFGSAGRLERSARYMETEAEACE